ncbi:MAG TPA: PEP-CTERM sorting domain-containing protein [Acetobacteraceae bacterium]
MHRANLVPTILAAASLACLAASAPASATVEYNFAGGSGEYRGLDLIFETPALIAFPYTVASPSVCNACSSNAEFVHYGAFGGADLFRVLYQTPGAGYAVYFPVGDLASYGTYRDDFNLGATLTISVVSEPTSLALLGCGLLGLGIAARRRPSAIA